MKLKDYLKKYKITIPEFAKRTDMSPNTLASYMCGWRQPSLKTAKRIEKESDGVVKVADMRRANFMPGVKQPLCESYTTKKPTVTITENS